MGAVGARLCVRPPIIARLLSKSQIVQKMGQNQGIDRAGFEFDPHEGKDQTQNGGKNTGDQTGCNQMNQTKEKRGDYDRQSRVQLDLENRAQPAPEKQFLCNGDEKLKRKENQRVGCFVLQKSEQGRN